MLTKFKKQKNPWDCAILALINSLIFLKKDFSYKLQYAWFKSILDLDTTGDEPGVKFKEFNAVVFGLFKKVKRKLNPSLLYLQKEANKKNLIIFGAEQHGLNHIGLITKINKRHAILINWGTKHPVERRITIRELNHLLSGWCVCYIVAKES